MPPPPGSIRIAPASYHLFTRVLAGLCISLCNDSSSSAVIMASHLGVSFSHVLLTAGLASIYVCLFRLGALPRILNGLFNAFCPCQLP